ncbi:MAG: NAD(P)-dependent oxidoreductase [Candidatus Brocadiaceae bacterium]|jgi:nucleoside-diphosphate-sugar epimerase
MRIERVLLTGGTGLVGRALAPLLAERWELRHFDVCDPGDGHPGVAGDLRDVDALRAACQGVDAVVHVAALHGRAWREAGDEVGFEVNVLGTRNVLAAAASNGVQRVVFTSSIWATGHGTAPPYLPIDEELPRQPAELYGLTKKLGEQMCAYYSTRRGVSTVCLRPGGILPADAPPRDRVRLLFGAVDVRDVARAHLLALTAPDDLEHGVFIVMPDTPLSEVEPAGFLENPVGALDERVPGLAACVNAGKLTLPTIGEWYTNEKARRVLGFEPQHGFDIQDYV